MALNMRMAALEEENKKLKKEISRLELKINDIDYKFRRLTRQLSHSNGHS